MDDLFGRFCFHHHRHAMAIEFATDFRDGKAPSRAMHQTHAQAILQHGYTSAESGPRHPEPASRRSESLLVHHLDKETKIIEILHG
jgi:hypothetical protein